MDEANRRTKTGYPRRRALAACLICRERKRKCDNLRPACSSCRQIGAQCQYSQQDASSFDAASLKILDQLSVIESLVRDIHVSPSFGAPSLSAASNPPSQGSLPVAVGGDEYSTPERLGFTLNLDASLSAGTDKLLQWPVFERHLSSLRRFQFIDLHDSEAYTYLDDLVSPSDTPASRSLLEPSWDPSHQINISTERSDIEQLVDCFFKRVNIKNPILSRHVIRQYCQQYYEHGPQFNLETCLVLLICALGAISTELNPLDGDDSCESPSPSNTTARLAKLRLGHCYFVAAEKRLGTAMSSVGILAIQCLCIAGIYHMYSIRPVQALRMFHVAGSSLQVFLSTNAGLERNSQMISSLFWTCYKSEREILAEIPIGTPALRDPASPDSYPPPPQATSSASDEWTALEEDSWYFLLSEIALRRITDQVGEMAFKYIDAKVYHHQSPSIEELVPVVAEFERQAETFREFLPAPVKFPDVPEEASTEWKQYSRGRYYRVLELMHRPFIFTAIHEPNCSNAVLALAEKGLLNALRYLEHSHTSHRHHGLWLQLRNLVKEASLLLAASKTPELKMPEGWEAGIAKTLRILNYWSLEFASGKKYVDVIVTLSESRLADLDEDTLISYT